MKSHNSICGLLSGLVGRVFTGSRLIALGIIVVLTSVAMQPAQAQIQNSSDTWKSVAIIGGSTAAGAYIGHKIGGSTGAYIGAGVGAATGYAIDRRRRQNQVYNQGAYDPNAGYYPDTNAGYYPDPNGGYYPNSGGPYDASAYPPPPPYYPGNYYSGNANRRSFARRSR